MAPSVLHLGLSGATILRDGRMERGDIAIEHGRITDEVVGKHKLDMRGYDILPGIIDLHGDAFEHHIAPRPSAPFPLAIGLAATDRDAAASGVTTAWMAQCWSWEGGTRGPDFAETFLDALEAHRSSILTDLKVQIRCETHTVDTQDQLIALIRKYGIDYVIFNNHLDEALEMARTNDPGLVKWAARTGRSVDEHSALVKATLDLGSQVPRYLCNLATAFDNLGVRYGSHDDTDGSTREYYAMIGAKICEFPTHYSAASSAKAWRDPVVMGAPNVVRGGSQSGNIPAVPLIKDGLCDALVSDYHYPSLPQAAFALSDAGVMTFADSWALLSENPARIMGREDRGRIACGLRADLTIINSATRQIEGTMANGRWSYLAGGLAHRLTETGAEMRLAAE